jgi:hypothetical protein
VASCDDDLFPPLSTVVVNDISRMAAALRDSGYEVKHCGVADDSGQEPTGSRIRSAMLRAFREVPIGSTLVIYFSGHGVVVNGQSFLVPQDVFEGSNGPDPDSLVPLVPRTVVECRARLVVFFIDACRNSLAADLSATPRGGALSYPDAGSFVLFNSCSAGERSLYTEDGSYFTQALTEVLDRRHPARTLDDLHKAVVQELRRKAARTDGLEQTPDVIYLQRGAAVAPGTITICEGDEIGEAWRRAVIPPF